MTHSVVPIIERSVLSTNTWLKQLGEDRGDAYRVLRAVLHTLRDRLTVDEAAQFAAQLPELVRGVFYDSAKPAV